MLTMVANHHFTRVDISELKDLIYRTIGHQRADKYFDQLRSFFSLRSSKADFDKICIRTIGRENIWLHNKLIRSIVQNACQAKIPPQKAGKVGLDVKVANGYQRNCMQSLYGDAFTQSPRKCRSPVNRDRKFRDRPSPLGPLGKSPSTTGEETVTRTQEQQSATEMQSLCSRPPVALVEDGEEVEQFSGGNGTPRWGSVTAPPGVSMNTADVRVARHCGYRFNTFTDTCQNSLELPDTGFLMSRLEKKLASEGVGISLDCANLLNNSLDAYLKRLIKPCIEIAGSRCTEPRQMASGLNGTFAERHPQSKNVVMLDFRVAMESNPRILGEDWAIQLEKICHYASGS